MRTRTTGMQDAFGNALMVEVEDLFSKNEVFQQRGTSRTKAETILVVGNARTMVGGEKARGLRVGTDLLMHFPAIADSGRAHSAFTTGRLPLAF